MFALQRLPVALILSLQAYLSYAAPTDFISRVSVSRQKYIDNSISAANALNDLYFDSTTGLWDDMWWQSANFLCTLADLTDLAEGRFLEVSRYYFQTSVEQARRTNGGDFHNAFYDDEGWFAMALIRTYDITRTKRYLEEAEETFSDMTTGRTAICGEGGHWWSKDQDYIASISSELFLNVAAALGNRIPDRADYYRDLALSNVNWFLSSGLITTNDTVSDGIDITTCEPTGTVFTYNSGVIIGALTELHALTANTTYIATAHRLVTGALTHLVDDEGVLTETGYPEDLDPTRAMFKGVFVRNLKYLHAVEPREEYVQFLQKNADSLWRDNRDEAAKRDKQGTETERGLVGPNWQGRYWEATASSQGSGLDLLVAAAAVSV